MFRETAASGAQAPGESGAPSARAPPWTFGKPQVRVPLWTWVLGLGISALLWMLVYKGVAFFLR